MCVGRNERGMKEVIMQVQSFSADYPKAPTYVGDLVRCKDCKHYEFADNRAFGMPIKYCDWFGFEDVDDNDFCSRGERKDGDSK